MFGPCSLVIGAAWVVTEAARALAQDKAEALRRAGLDRASAVEGMGLVNEAQLSDQLAPRLPLNAYRWSDLCERYPAVEEHYLQLRAERRGFFLIAQRDLAVLARVAVRLEELAGCRLLRRA